MLATIQIVLDKELLQATDQAASRNRQNRSSLVRDALREHLRRLDTQAKEKSDREGYSKQPQESEAGVWDGEAVWPED